jgi:hypothetical protein
MTDRCAHSTWSVALLAAICLCLHSCGGQADRPGSGEDAAQAKNAVPLAHPAGLAALPPPSRLKVRSAGPGSDLRAEGDEYLSALANANLLPEVIETSSISFAPSHTPGGPASGLAFGIYELDTTAYGGDTFFTLKWDTAPAEGAVFLGLADFTRNAWDWFALPASNELGVMAGFDGRYRNGSDQTFAAVLLTGSTGAVLDYVRLGENLPPLPALEATPPSGNSNDTFTLDASATVDGDGEIANYTFFANETLYDNGADPVLPDISFSSPGDQFCVVTVTDDDGQQEQANVTIPVAAAPNAVLDVAAPRIDISSLVDFDASASTGGEGIISKYEFDPEGDGSFIDNGTDPVLDDYSYSSAGYFNATLRITTDIAEMDTAIVVMRVDWRHTYNSMGYAGIYELRPAADGGCFVCGTLDSDALVMRPGPDGEPLWKRRLGDPAAPSVDDFSGMALGSDGYVYVAGRQHYDTGMGEGRYVKMLQIDINDAGLGFERYLDLGAEQPNTGDLDLLVDSQGDLHLVARIEDGSRTDLCVFRFDNNGIFELGRRWDDSGSTINRNFGGAALDGADNLYINSYSQVETNNNGRRLLLLSLTRDYAERWARLLEVTHNSETPDLLGEGICASGSSLFVTATLQSSDHHRAMLLKVGSDGSLTEQRAFSPQAGVTEFALGHCASDGFGGLWCGGLTQESGSANLDSMLFRFSSALDIQLSRHFGLSGVDDDSENCTPAAGPDGAVLYGGFFNQHNAVVNDYVYSFETLDSLDWQTPGAPQDLDNYPASTVVHNSSYEDFSFGDTDSGGGFVTLYHP